MATKNIGKENMQRLRNVLRGQDAVAIWDLIQELGLLPNDKVRRGNLITDLKMSGARARAGRNQAVFHSRHSDLSNFAFLTHALFTILWPTTLIFCVWIVCARGMFSCDATVSTTAGQKRFVSLSCCWLGSVRVVVVECCWCFGVGSLAVCLSVWRAGWLVISLVGGLFGY